MRRKAAENAFTLLESLIVIGIIGCLAGLLMPALELMQQRANAINCVSNLRQIGIAGQLYAAEHSQNTPLIEPWPSQPIYSAADGAQSILAALQPYGVTQGTLTCRADIAGPNYFAKEGSSYEWCVLANGQNIQSAKIVWGGRIAGVTLSQLIMAFDYTNVHGGASNVLFGDGHIAGN